jgi:hypothetical protein
MVKKGDEDDDRDRNAEQPKQNSTAQETLLVVAMERKLTGDKQAFA